MCVVPTALIALGILVASPSAGDATALLKPGRAALARGNVAHGIEIYIRPAIEIARKQGDVNLHIEALLLLGEAYGVLGRTDEAIASLETARDLATSNPTPNRLIRAHDRLGVAYRAAGRLEDARVLFERGLAQAQSSGRIDLEAALLNDLGTVQVALGESASALDSFRRSVRLADQTGQTDLVATAGINLTKALIDRGAGEDLEATLADNLRTCRAMSESRRKAVNLLSVGLLYRAAQWRFGYPAIWRKHAFESYRAGLEAARGLEDRRLLSYAHGFTGQLYEDEGRDEEALRHTRRAVLAAQNAGADAVLYRWEWQAARLLRNLGRTEEAVVSYRQAIRTLQKIRFDLTRSGASLREMVGTVFLELADLLLSRASTLEDADATQRDLLEVRATLEQLKQAEVQEYFDDECVVTQRDPTEVDRLAGEAAILYPVLLPDRTEILVSLPHGLERFTLTVGSRELTAEIRSFRRGIDSFGLDEAYLPHARQLYDWLIAPFEASLERERIKTLVVVPDGPFRTIPLAALHDGERFLVERLAVVTTPGLTLTDPRPLPGQEARTLAGGLTESVQGFEALPHVELELAGIEKTYPTTLLQDRNFQIASVEQEVSEGAYSIVHFATHGQFDSDHTKSFLLTYEGKITMDRLQEAVARRRYQEQPVELLVLSACQTAAGDDRAALGLAGVALKAGARSALASLWSINDESTAAMVSEFYRVLQQPGKSKAEALQAAQLALLRQERFEHPFHWAPFLLIGNWI